MNGEALTDDPFDLDSEESKDFLNKMANAPTQLETYMLGMCLVMRKHKRENFKYTCIEEFILRHGRSFTPGSLPKKYKRGVIKECYNNCYNLSKKHNLIYVEGYAIHVIPVLHAWCVLPGSNKVIDPTWKKPGIEYFGVMFNSSFLEEHWKRNKSCAALLDNYEEEWPLLTGIEGFKYENDSR